MPPSGPASGRATAPASATTRGFRARRPPPTRCTGGMQRAPTGPEGPVPAGTGAGAPGSGTITGIAKAVSRRGASRSDVADLTALLRQYEADLADAQGKLDSHAAQLAELQERVDFAERLLAQARERKGLGSGESAPPAT